MSNIKQTPQKSRILFRADSVENWVAEEDNNFQTLRGELYFYENAKDTGRINHVGQKIFKPSLKIGNGAPLKNLTFWGESYITISKIDQLFSSMTHSGILGLNTLSSFYLGKTGSTSANSLPDEDILDEPISR